MQKKLTNLSFGKFILPVFLFLISFSFINFASAEKVIQSIHNDPLVIQGIISTSTNASKFQFLTANPAGTISLNALTPTVNAGKTISIFDYNYLGSTTLWMLDKNLNYNKTSGFIGIGTTNPGAKLDIVGALRATNATIALLGNSGDRIVMTDNSGNLYATSSASIPGLPVFSPTNATSGQTLRFTGTLWEPNSIIFNNGTNVGIGTPSPGVKLEVAGAIRTNNQLISTIANGTAPLVVTSKTLVSNLNVDQVDGFSASDLQFFQSDRDFATGTLIKTDINYSASSGEPFLLEIEGNSYGSQYPFNTKIQGYIYSDTIISKGGVSIGTPISQLVAFNYDGKLCFWFPRQSYWQGFSVFVNSSYSGVKKNRLVSITSEAKPTEITKEVSFNIIESAIIGGTTNYLSKFSGNKSIINSLIYDNGTYVGISKASPAYKLDVYGDGNFNGQIHGVSSPTQSTDAANKSYVDSTVVPSLWTANGNNINNSNTGNVGVGVTAPTKKLDVAGDFQLPATIGPTSPSGVIYKNGERFIHDFSYGLNTQGKIPVGQNLFVGINAGNFLVGKDGPTSEYGSYNVGVGYLSLSALTTGQRNTAIGHKTLSVNTSGFLNTAVGNSSLSANTSGNYNSAFGDNSLKANTTGTSNSAFGVGALAANSTGTWNVAMGSNSLTSNTTGSDNVSIGSNALSYVYTNSYNVALGSYALQLAVGSNNTALGYQAGATKADAANLASANDSIFLGKGTKANNNLQSNQIVIGNNAVGIGSNSVVLGNDSIATTVLKGSVGVGITDPLVKLDVDGLIKMRASNITTSSDVINKGYLDSALQTLAASTNAESLWAGSLAGNIYNKNTGFVGVGISVPGQKLDVSGSIRASGQLMSTVANGTAPLVVTSSTLVPNLNVTYLNGQNGSYYDQRSYSSATNYLGGGYVGGGLEKPNWTGFGAGKLKLQMLSGANVGAPDNWNDVLWMSAYTGGDVKNSNALIFGKGTVDRIGFVSQAFDATSWGTYREIYHSGNSNLSTVNWSANNVYAAGKVGIGTTSPSVRLDLGGGTAGRITGLDTAPAAVRGDSEAVPKKWIVDNFAPAIGGASLWASTTHGTYNVGLGKVGIGTAYPSFELDVLGTVRANNFVGNLLGFVSAVNVSSGTFGSLAGEGNYVFPAMLTVNGDSLFYGTSTFATNVRVLDTLEAKKLKITQDIDIPMTDGWAPYKGVIYKGGMAFLYDFRYGASVNGVYPDGFNLFLGYQAGNFTMGQTATNNNQSSYNIGIGKNSLTLNTLGARNISLGTLSMFGNQTGSDNVAIGYEALRNGSSGNKNSVLGAGAMWWNIGEQNTVMGFEAIKDSQNGSYNSAFGAEALKSNGASYNVAFGVLAGTYLSNSMLDGRSANSVFIGSKTKALGSTQTNQIVIGYEAVGAGSNSVVLGNNSIIKTILKGDVAIGTTSPQSGYKLTVAGSIYADGFVYSTSDARLKHDVKTLGEEDYQKILKLRPVSFTYNKDDVKGLGFIAQELEKYYPEAVKSSGPDGMKAISYTNLISPTIVAVQEQQKKIDQQETLIHILLDRVNKLENKVK